MRNFQSGKLKQKTGRSLLSLMTVVTFVLDSAEVVQAMPPHSQGHPPLWGL